MKKILVLFIGLFLCFSAFPQGNTLGNLIQTLERNYESAKKKGNVKSPAKLTEKERLSILNEVAYNSMIRSHKELDKNSDKITLEERTVLAKNINKECYLTNTNDVVYIDMFESESLFDKSKYVTVSLSYPDEKEPKRYSVVEYLGTVVKKTDGILKDENGDVVSAYIILETNDDYVGVFPPLRFIIVQDVVDAEKFTITLEGI